MPSIESIFIGLGVAVLIYALGLAGLVIAGRRADAVALARFIPDCLVLLKRLMGDPAVPRSRKLVLGVLVAYLMLPIDLVPDFLPAVGQLDDVIVAALALRYALRGGGPGLLRAHWPGPQASLDVVMRLAYGRI